METLYDYSDQVKFRSKASVDDCIRRLKGIVKSNNPAFALFSLTSRPVLVGRVDGNGVALHRVSPLIGNPYRPYFYGKFVREVSETVLKGKFTISHLAKVIDTLLLIALAIFVIALIIASFSSSAQFQSGWVTMLILLAICIVGVGMLKLTKRMSSRDVDWISGEIKSALRA